MAWGDSRAPPGRVHQRSRRGRAPPLRFACMPPEDCLPGEALWYLGKDRDDTELFPFVVQASAGLQGLVPGHFRQELPGRGAKKMPAPRLSSGMPALPARLPPGNGQSSTQACPFPPDPEQYQAKACTTNKAVPVRSPGFSLSLPAVPSRSLLLIPRTSPRPGLASLREHCGRIHVRDKRPRAGQHIPMPGVASQSNR